MSFAKPRLLVAAVLLLAAFAVPVTAASAQPMLAPAAGNCPKPKPYPPPPNATVRSSATVVRVGEHIEVSGVGYCIDEDVDITIAGQHVGTAHTNNQGSFDPSVVVPGPAGTKQLCGIGASGLKADSDCLTLNAEGTGNESSGAPGTSSGGGTAFTGVEIALLVALALLLLAGGVAFSTAGRSRKSVSQV